MSKFKRPLYPPGTTFEYFNIHHKGVIPYLNITGPYYNINLNKKTYELISRAGITIYPVWEDPIMEERKKKAKQKKEIQAEVERQLAEKEKIRKEEERKKREAEEALNQLKPSIVKDDLDDEEDLPEPVTVIVGSDGSIRRKDEPVVQEEKKVEEIEVEDDVIIEEEEVIEEEVVVKERGIPRPIPIRRVKTKKENPLTDTYTRDQLLEMTNEEIKDIIRSKGHPEKRGDSLAPKYADTKEDLIRKVLELN